MRFRGNRANIYKAAFQYLHRSGQAGDQFLFGITSRANNVPADALYRVEVRFHDSQNMVIGTSTIALAPGTHGFQFFGGTATAPGDYQRISFRFVFKGTRGQVWFDDAFMVALP